MKTRWVATLLLALTLSNVSQAGAIATSLPAQECAQIYRVQPGDFLFDIARRFNIAYPDLLNLNQEQLPNPNLIYPGQSLCLQAVATPSAFPTPAHLVLEANYEFVPADDEEATWNLMTNYPYLGQRMTFELQAENRVYAATSQTITTHYANGPVMVLVQNSNQENTLAIVGKADILRTLYFYEPQPFPLGVSQPLTQALGPNILNLSVWLEADSITQTIRYAYPISRVEFIIDTLALQQAIAYQPQNADILLAMFPADTGQPGVYRLEVALEDETIGPPGDGWRERCNSWKRGGRFYQWLRSVYSCP